MADKVLTPGNKVARLGEWFRLSQGRWATILGIKRGSITAYKARTNANPSTERLRDISTRYGVPMTWFLDGKDTDPPVSRDIQEAEDLAKDGSVTTLPKSKQDAFTRNLAANAEVALPVWRGVAAAHEDECAFTDETYESPESVPGFFISNKDPSNFIVCVPTGYSMAERIIQGDRVIIRLEPTAAPNTIVIARRPDGLNFIKVYRVRKDQPELHSINEKFKPITNLNEWIVKAVVVGIWKPYITDDLNIEFLGGAPLRA